METVLVFKTSVLSETDIKRLRPVLNGLIQHNERWNFDLEDCDKILRIESIRAKANAFMAALHSSGYACEELET